MRSVAWQRVVTTTVVVPLLLLGGCGSDEPVVRPSSTTSEAAASPTPSPSPTLDLTRLPEQPAAMAEPTTDGAIAAATYVLELYTYTVNTGDTGPWRAITLDSCVFCAGVLADVDEVRAAGDEIVGGAVTVRRSQSAEISEDTWFSVDLIVDQEASQRRDGDGQFIGENPATSYSAVFALSWAEGWRVDEMGVEPVATDAETPA